MVSVFSAGPAGFAAFEMPPEVSVVFFEIFEDKNYVVSIEYLF